jgi:hypothetical protein
MKLEEAKNKFQGQWIAFRYYDEDSNPEGEVLLHKQNRREFDKELIQSGIKDVYITYAGPSFPPGYAALF